MMMWEDTQGDMKAKCSYIKETNEYLVEVLLRTGNPSQNDTKLIMSRSLEWIYWISKYLSKSPKNWLKN